MRHPAPIPRVAAELFGRFAAAHAGYRLHRAASSGRDVLVGPWLSEVGFELLYWIPFLTWAVVEFDLPPDRLVAISRGGADSWYAGLCGRYVDVLDRHPPEEYRARNQARAVETRGQKQMAGSRFDGEVLRWAQTTTGQATVDTLHPAVMHNLFRPFWWGRVPTNWVRRFTRFRRLSPPPPLPSLPDRFVAVKLYFNDGFPDTPANRRLAAEILDGVASIAPVVILSTGVMLDEHREIEVTGDGHMRDIADRCTPRNNLQVQSAVIAQAQAFVGTYGGLSYLPPAYGIPAMSLYSVEGGFHPTHLRLAREVFASSDVPWSVADTRRDRIEDLLEAVRRHLAR